MCETVDVVKEEASENGMEQSTGANIIYEVMRHAMTFMWPLKTALLSKYAGCSGKSG